MAAMTHTHQGMPAPSARNSAAQVPAVYWPEQPMLNRPTLYANRMDSEHMSSGAVLTSVLPKYFMRATLLG